MAATHHDVRQILCHTIHYYGSSDSKTYYIGQLTQDPTQNDDSELSEVEIKFLERKMSNGQYTFKWPKRPDIASVDMHTVIKEIPFKGLPAFYLNAKSKDI